MRSVRDLPALAHTPVLVRAALNVPLERGVVANEYRLRRALLTIRHLSRQGARIILISHLGEGGTETLEPVARALGSLIPGVSFFGETIGERVRAKIRALAPGDIVVLENLRRDRGERENNYFFAKELAALADVFVQDSFDTCHRPHASIVGVPELLPSYAGLLLEEEVRELSRVRAPSHPSLAVIGGAKFSTKEDLLTSLLTAYDHVFVGGALANDLLKYSGYSVGKSLVSETAPEASVRNVLAYPNIVLPMDSLVVPADAVGTLDVRAVARTVSSGGVESNEVILDHGPNTRALLKGFVRKAKTILWNGPLGNYENGFVDTTDELARAIAASHAHSVIGGGDTVAAIQNLGLLSRFSFVSTGGGAMLEFLTKGTLPGIDALNAHVSN